MDTDNEIESRARQVLGLDDGDANAFIALKGVFTRRQDHLSLAELLKRRSENASYSFERAGRPRDKRVSFYLFRYRSGDLRDHDHEIEDARWIPGEQAARTLTYEGEREMVARALSRSAPDR